MRSSFFLKHDASARYDERMIRLRRQHGVAGYGTFWHLLEMLLECSGHKLRLASTDDIAYELRVEKEMVESVIKDFNLFKLICYFPCFNSKMVRLKV